MSGIQASLRGLFAGSSPRDLAIGAVWQVLLLLAGALCGMWITNRYAEGLPETDRTRFVAICGASAAAAFVAVAILGFLFGVPRARVSVDAVDTSSRGGAVKVAETSSLNPGGTVPNTNLEQVSDWVTKIVVGIGLTQAGAIADRAQRLFEAIATSVGAPDAAPFVGALMVTAASVGFITGWLTARVWIARLLIASDNSAPATPAGMKERSPAG